MIKRPILSLLLCLLLIEQCIGACSPAAPNKASGTAATALTATVIITVANTTDLVAVSIWCVTACTVNSVQDGSGNVYTKTTNSPGATNSGSGTPYIYYRLAATSSGSITITATLASSIQHQVEAVDFSLGTSCTATFDKDTVGIGSGTSVTIPSITPTASGEILFGFVATAGTGVTAAGSPWTLGNIAATTGNADEYELVSSNTATALNFTQASATYSGISAAFALSSGAVFTPHLNKNKKLEELK